MSRAKPWSIGWLAIAFAGGCTVGPDYQRPAAVANQPVPAAFSTPATNGLPDWKTAEPAAHLPRGAWWRVFDDSVLDQLETAAETGNPGLAAALARLQEARATINIARAEFFPQIEVDPSVTRQRTSVNQPENGRAAGVSHTFNTFTLPFQAGWEADWFGRIRREAEAARANLAASRDDYETVKLALQSEIAADYFTLRALDSEYDLLQRSAETFRRSLLLTMNRRRGGIASDLDVAQAETQLRTVEADLPPLKLQRSRLLHALAALTGQAAPGFELVATPPASNALPQIPVSLPSELLERRPDIAASERRMAESNARVGVAQSAFYPRLRFNGLAGLQSVDAGSWFDWPSHFWSLGPTVELPLFTGGRNRAQLEFARAAYTENVANYRQTVLAAFQEVEDQLAAQGLLAAQMEAELAALKAAQRTLEIADNRYKAGLVTYLEVATAQSAALNLERTVVQLRGEKLVASVSLIKALGGGWQAEAQTAATRN